MFMGHLVLLRCFTIKVFQQETYSFAIHKLIPINSRNCNSLSILFVNIGFIKEFLALPLSINRQSKLLSRQTSLLMNRVQRSKSNWFFDRSNLTFPLWLIVWLVWDWTIPRFHGSIEEPIALVNHFGCLLLSPRIRSVFILW